MEKPVLKIKLKTQEGFQFIDPYIIISARPDNRRTILNIDGNQKLIAHHGIEELCILLDYPWIFRNHKSSFINLHKIVAIDKNYTQLTMNNGDILNISKRRKTGLKKAHLRFYKSN